MNTKIQVSVAILTILLLVKAGLPVFASQALQLSQATDQPTDPRMAEADRLLLEGAKRLQAGDSEGALPLLQQALTLFRQISSRQLEVYALTNIGSVYFIRKDYKKAIEWFSEALQIAKQVKDQHVEKATLVSLGNVYQELEDHSKAVIYYQQSLEICRILKGCEEQTKILVSLGNSYYFLKEYNRMIDINQEALELSRRLKDRKNEGNALGNLGLAYSKKSNYRQAASYFQQNLVIVKELKDQQAERKTLRNLSNALFSARDYAKAIEYLQQNLGLARTQKDIDEEIFALGRLGDAYSNLENYLKAIEYYQQLLRIATDLKDLNLSKESLKSLGAAYFSLKEYSQIIQYYQKAFAIAKELKNQKAAGEFLIDIGVAFKLSENYQKAVELYSEALLIGKETNEQDLMSIALNNLGDVFILIQDYGQAIDYLQQSLSVTQKLQNQNLKAQIELRTLDLLAQVYRFLEDEEQALEYAQRSLVISRQNQDKSREATTLKLIGFLHLKLRRYKEANDFYRQSLELARSLKDKELETDILAGLGSFYFSLGQPQEAIEYLQQSLVIAQQIKDEGAQMVALGNLGTVYSSLMIDLPKALTYIQASLEISKRKKKSEIEFGLLTNLGRIFFLSENFKEAEKTLHEAIEVANSLRSRLGRKDIEKVLLQERMRQAYDYLQQTLIAQKKINTALEISEQSRARALADLLNNRISSRSTTEFPQNESLNVEQLQKIAQAQQATVVQYSIAYKPARVAIPGLLPGISLPAIDTQAQAEIFIWVITPTGEITFRRVDFKPFHAKQEDVMMSLGPLREIVSITRDAMGVRSAGRSDISVALSPEVLQEMQKQEKHKLQQLHQLLIEPIADLLPTNPDDHVVFMPQGSLFLVPFPALQDANGKYLIEKHTILTAPSIQVLQQTRQLKATRSATTGKNKALVLGNPVMPKVALSPGQPPQPLTPLPGAEREAIAIAPLLNTQPILGNQATKAAIIQKMPQANIIHLATHGLLDDQRGLGSAIALAPDPTQPEDRFGRSNGLLTAEEILDMQLSADLVVLSACDTGRGRITGDGVIGLSRSFITAGVPSVIVSLWAVPDAPTAELMTEFYKNWKERNLDKAQALRQAMLTTMKTHPNPRDWAAFTLIGEAE
ncbi:MAG: CHAT domain-containing tetratricopeptide repeat protein [Leptolyngbyaceae cyanobacterium bins.349]|nr:CHAT domain-containing tetratricopeptide repeat protein [Leptolyngbyaceae cyanobacterium bins.349]